MCVCSFASAYYTYACTFSSCILLSHTAAEVKGLCATYQRIILVPRPDYASRVILWRSIIFKHSGQITDGLDLSSLAKVTDGYTPGHLENTVVVVLTERRVQQVE